MTRWIAAAVCALVALPVRAERAEVPQPARQAQIVFLGEVHDNPDHHLVQAEWVRALAPSAVVFEMIDTAVAASLTGGDRADAQTLAAALGWDGSGWPDFAMYWPVFDALGSAEIYGAAVPRGQAREVFAEGPGAVLSEAEITRFALDQPLPEDQQSEREQMQFIAHCEAMPLQMMGGMVSVQRVRDALLASAALAALEATGGPVVVVTGNGHARTDWGAPAAVRLAAPEVTVFSLGQGEDGRAPDGVFDHTADAPAAQRDDPCAAFEK